MNNSPIVSFEEAPVICQRDVSKISIYGNPCIVHPSVEASETLPGSGCDFMYIFFVSDVGNGMDGFATRVINLVCKSFQRFLIARCQHETSTLCGCLSRS